MKNQISKFIVTLNRLSHRAKTVQFVLLCISCLLFTCSASLYLGGDVGYDLKNYHLYNAWALLNNRSEIDFFAAGLHTYFQPLLDLPYYWLSFVWFPDSPKLVTFLMGIPSGIFLTLACLIVFHVLKSIIPVSRIFLYILSIPFVLFGISNSFFWEVGCTAGDTPVACLALGAIYVLLRCREQPPIASAIAGVLIGITVGLKLTAAAYSIPFLLAIPFFFSTKKQKIQTLIFFALGCGIGFLLIYGWWSWRLFQETGNPVFPVFDNIYPKWISQSGIGERVARQFPDGSLYIREVPNGTLDKIGSIFTLYHFGFISICIGICLALLILKKWFFRYPHSFGFHNNKIQSGILKTELLNFPFYQASLAKTNTFLVVFYFGTLLFWRWHLLNPRYILALEALCGLCIVTGILRLSNFKMRQVRSLLFLSISVLVAMKIGFIGAKLYSPATWREYSRWCRFSGQEKKWEVPSLPENTLVLTGGKTSGLAPYLTQKTPSLIFVGGAIDFLTGKSLPDSVIKEKISEKIKKHQGPIYFLTCIADSRNKYRPMRDKNGMFMEDGKFLGETNNFPQYGLALEFEKQIEFSNKFGIFLLIPTKSEKSIHK